MAPRSRELILTTRILELMKRRGHLDHDEG
jgi:hypothetical protein